ncbi:hypothetical protein LMG10661_03573 [Ralstonia syzygii subsp. syzygii]|nr:hypothetical protein LMG10661_03573 [Ralstonia syzygii subsp. syzygii]
MTHSMAHIGVLPAGARNSITDVAGVTVGHATLAGGSIQTGVTVVRRAQRLRQERRPAAGG